MFYRLPRNVGSLAVPLGFDAVDRLGGGPPDGVGVVAGQVDGDGVGATWTVTIWRAWTRPRAIFSPAAMMTPVLLATLWTVTGSADGRGGRPGWAGAVEQPGLVPGQRAPTLRHRMLQFAQDVGVMAISVAVRDATDQIRRGARWTSHSLSTVR
jgi:hypothetical protein